jgi:UDP-2,3-diacylglucosamine hydrolase
MELRAPTSWQCIDFISDLHLQVSEQLNFAGFRGYLERTCADAVFILGDLFEVWVGDDILSTRTGFEWECSQALRSTSDRLSVYVMQGNRDFLMGDDLMQACGATLLDDPTVLTFGGTRWLLTHGDALCLADSGYIQFRSVVRTANWQQEFLAKPLQDRLDLARAMREQSESRKQANAVVADVDPAETLRCLQEAHAHHIVHGHTHKPCDHDVPGYGKRFVLSDWDLTAPRPRAEVLRVCIPDGKAGEPSVKRIDPLSAASLQG